MELNQIIDLSAREIIRRKRKAHPIKFEIDIVKCFSSALAAFLRCGGRILKRYIPTC